MLRKEILDKVRGIQIYARRIVNEIPSGQYASAFKGSGIEFEEVREYQPGDDVRTIDWNVSARMGYPYVKRFVEERELTVILAVDLSPSEAFGTHLRSKAEVATELSAILAFLATTNNDKVGLIAFSDKVNLYIPPEKGRRHALRVIREVLCLEPTGTGTDINQALDYLNRVVRRQAVVFLISDFHTSNFGPALRLTGTRHDITGLRIIDPWELSLPDIGLITFEDSETGEYMTVDTGSESVRKRYAALTAKHTDQLDQIFRSASVDHIDIRMDKSYLRPLTDLLKRRELRRRRVSA